MYLVVRISLFPIYYNSSSTLHHPAFAGLAHTCDSHIRDARLPLVFLFPFGEGVFSLLCSQLFLQRPAGKEKDPPPRRLSGALCCGQDNLANELVKGPLVTRPGLPLAHLGNSTERPRALCSSAAVCHCRRREVVTLGPLH